MSEMRWNPLLAEWVVTSTHRQSRTFLPPADFCPLCPTNGSEFPTEIPATNYEIVVFENKFPSLRRDPPIPTIEGTSLSPVRPAQGICEVVVYTPNHNATLADLSKEQLRQLIEVWTDRYIELGRREEINYIFIFENKGEAIGVTLNHPHGQIYAFTYIPPIPEREIAAAKRHYEQTGHCLICDIVEMESAAESRCVTESEFFYAVIPFFARWPYEIHIYSKTHSPSIAHFTVEQKNDLAGILKDVLRIYDGLWEELMPYIMAMHQAPTDKQVRPGDHFHIEFYPPMRTKTKQKYRAGCETGAGTFVLDTLPEDTARELREVRKRLGK